MKGFMLHLLAWNAYIANSDDNVAETLNAWVAAHQPDVMALSEVTSHADVLARVAPLLGYRVIQQTPARGQPRGDDTGDCALLLAAHVELRHTWVARMRQRWRVVSHDRWHKPHAYVVAAIRVRGQRWRVRSSHWPTLGLAGPNAAAWRESARKSRRWLRRGLVPSVDVGDLNEKKPTVAAWFGKRYRVAGSGIDILVTRRVAHASAMELGKGGGDHHGRIYQLVAAL